MNKTHLDSKVNEVKGRVKEEVGHATNNSKLAGEGVLDRVKGKIQEGFADVKDAVKRKVDDVLGDEKRAS